MNALNLDLDAPSPAPTRPARRLRWPAVAVVGAGLLLGGSVAAFSSPAAPPAGAEVVARVELGGLDLAPQAQARLTVTVRNTGGTAARIGPLWPRDGGLSELPVALSAAGGERGGGLLRPGEVRVLTGAALLRCDPAGVPAGPSSGRTPQPLDAGALRARLEVVDGESVIRAVTVVSGVLSRTGGACAAARGDLPRGWAASAPAAPAAVFGDMLELTLPRLPGPTRYLVGLRADGWYLTAGALGQDVSAAPVQVRVPRPVPACRDLARRLRVAGGVELVLIDPDGDLSSAFVPVGTVLTRWLADTYAAACPADAISPAETQES